MAMRQDCKHFESRTFADGDTISQCTLNLAPEAPWRCPPDCQSYKRRRVGVNLSHQGLAQDSTTDVPESLGDDSGGGDSSIADLLEDAAKIVDSAAPTIADEVRKEAKGQKGFRKLFRRKKS